MSVNIQNITISPFYLNKEISVPIQFATNKSDVIASNVVVTLDKTPDGLEYVRSNMERGTWDNITRTWTIGTMSPQESLMGEIIYKVTDDCAHDFRFIFQMSSSGCEACLENNTLCVNISGISCCDLTPCFSFKTETFTVVGATKVHLTLAEAPKTADDVIMVFIDGAPVVEYSKTISGTVGWKLNESSIEFWKNGLMETVTNAFVIVVWMPRA